MSTTLFVDGNNYFIRTFFSKTIDFASDKPDLRLWEYISVDNLLNYIAKFKVKEIIIAIDSPNSWRKIAYPGYKAKRKRDNAIKWDLFFEAYGKLQKELAENLPFKVFKLDHCEADDIIGVLVKLKQKSVILSTDVDFVQCIDKNVKVYDAYREAFKEPIENFLELSALNGQSKDDIPNVITALGWEGPGRRPAFGEKKAKKIIAEGIDDWLFLNNAEKRFTQNLKLIDFNRIPKAIVEKICLAHNSYTLPDPQKITKYFLKKQWRKHIDDISNIENRLLRLY